MYLLEADSDLYGNDPQIRSDNSSIVPPKRDDVEVGTGARGWTFWNLYCDQYYVVYCYTL